MKHLDNFLAAVAFGLCTITLATLLGVSAGWAYGALGDYERELIALASNPVLFGVVTAIAAPRGSVESARRVHLEPMTVVGRRPARNEHRLVAQALAPASSRIPHDKS